MSVGECYEIVVTNPEGLCRYRLGDVIEIVGHTLSTPKYKFLYRYPNSSLKTHKDSQLHIVLLDERNSHILGILDMIQLNWYICGGFAKPVLNKPNQGHMLDFCYEIVDHYMFILFIQNMWELNNMDE